jgi:hypothetical protein
MWIAAGMLYGVFVISAVPLDVVVRRTARVRLAATVAGCDVVEATRTARVRDGVVVVVTGVMVDGAVMIVLVLPMLLPLLLIMLGRDAADGIETFPIARCCVADGAVTAAVVVVVGVSVVVPARAGATGFTARVGDGTPSDDCVGVGVPMTVRPGVAATADDAVRGAAIVPLVVVVPVPATVEAAVTPATVAPLTMEMPAPLSLMTAGVGSELIERLTVTSGFATSAGF